VTNEPGNTVEAIQQQPALQSAAVHDPEFCKDTNYLYARLKIVTNRLNLLTNGFAKATTGSYRSFLQKP
jgi:hypothetical protein